MFLPYPNYLRKGDSMSTSESIKFPFTGRPVWKEIGVCGLILKELAYNRFQEISCPFSYNLAAKSELRVVLRIW
jgi:hypothetical protein